MKRNLTIAITLCLAAHAYSQTNTFPSTGSVGIGTTSPQETLHVSGGNVGVLQSGTYSDVWSKWIRIGATNSASYPLYLGTNKNGISSIWDSDGAFFGLSDEGSNRKDAIIAWGDDADDNLRFLFNGGELARFTPAGFWGIGTSSPSTRLHISDGIPSFVQGLNAQTKLTIDAANGGFSEFRSSSDNNTYSGVLFTDNNLGGYVAFRNAPDDKLHVGGYGGILFEVGSENNVGAKAERMRIDASGNVAIGTSSANAKLEVSSAGTGGSTLVFGGVLGSKNNGHEMNIVGGTPIDGTWTTQQGGHIRLGGSGRGDQEVNAIQFIQSGVERMRVHNGGNVGIGVAAPTHRLHIQQTLAGGEVVPLLIQNYNPSPTAGEAVTLRMASTYIPDGQANGIVNITGVRAAPGSMDLNFQLSPGGAQSPVSRFLIQGETGNVGIGTTTPDAKLAVKGVIHSQEVKIDMAGAMAPDYVFEKDYDLPSLAQIKSYINQHKHLPEVPSAKEMETNGVNLGEMNMILLKKIEELTLFIIELKEENTELNKKITKIEQKVR